MVDCTEYKTEEVIAYEYDEDTAKSFLSGDRITMDEVSYYECEHSPYLTNDLELISDIS